MGGCTSKLVEPSSRKPASRAGSMHTSRAGEPDLSRSSLALAALPLTRPASCGGSSSSESDSGGGYASSSGSDCSDTVASTASTAFLASSRAAGGSTDGGSTPADGAAGGMRRALADIKTTYKLRVGVLEGTTFLNQYIVIDTLGRGSFGKVKLCLNTGDDRLYAVKVVNTRALRATARTRLRMRLRPAARPAAVANGAPGAPATSSEGSAAASSAAAGAGELEADLRREVEVMRALDHPNLLRLFEVIEDKEGGKVLMVMEYAEGGALVSPGALTPDRHLPEAMAQCYFRQIAAGLAYLHQHHVVHGDLKPENVMLCGRGTVKIGDFGQSQFFDRRDTFQRTLGTPAYLAPEVCAGQAYRGRQADVWALGVSLYYFIFGDMPFKAPSVLALYDAIAVGEVPYSRTRPISHELQDLFLRLLHRDPSRRITAEEVMRHPWVTLMPDFGAGLESPLEVGEAAAVEEEGQQHPPLAPFSAEEVAAVLFPLALQNELAAGSGGSPRGGSPRSAEDGGSTQLVDALAAAATASFGGSMAARLARSNSASKLHKLSEDSMVRRTLASSVRLNGSAAASSAPIDAGASNSTAASGVPMQSGTSDAAGSRATAAAAAAAARGSGGKESGNGVQPGAVAGGNGSMQEPAFGLGLVRTYAEQEEVPVLHEQQRAESGDGGFGAAAGAGSSGAGQQPCCTPVPCLEVSRQHQTGQQAVQPIPPCPLGSPTGDRLSMPNGRPAARAAQQALPNGQLFASQLTARLQQQGQQQQQQQGQQQQQQGQEQGAQQEQQQPVADASRATAWRSMLRRVSGGSTQPRGAQADGALDGPSVSPGALGTSLPTGGSFDAVRQPPRSRSLDLLRSIFTGPADFMGGPTPAIWEGNRAGDAAGDNGGGAVGVVRTSGAPTSPLPPPRRRAPLLFPGIGDIIEGVAYSPAAAGGTASRLPPRPPQRPPPPRPTLQQSIVVNIFRPGERLGQDSSATQQQTCFYIEQGVVEVRYEADVPITLSSVLSAAAGIFRRASGHASPSPTLSPEAAASPTAAQAPAGGAPGASLPQVFAAAVAAAQRQQGQQGKQQQRQGQSPQAAAGGSGPGLGPPTPAVGPAACAGAAVSAASHGRQPSPSPPHLGAEDAADLFVHGSHAFDLGVSAELQRQGSELMQRSASLAETVAQATLRAKALLKAAQAKGASLDHLLVCERTTGEFLGSLAMLDPSFLMGRWKATAVAKSHVVALHMTRQGLEQFLQQHPLAQVHLRASMACARAEVVKLEALEKIAVARQHQAQVQERQRPRRPRSQRSAPTSRHGSTLPTGAAMPTTPALAAPLGAPQGALAAAPAAAAEQQQAAPAAVAAVEQRPADADAGAAPAAAGAALEDAAVSAAAQQQVSAAAAGLEAGAARGEEEDETARDYAAAAEAAAAAAAHEEGEVSDADTLSSASSSSSSEEEEEEADGGSQLPAGRQLLARRPPGISVSEAHSTTLELFRVVSQLREAISDQLRDRLANRPDADDSLAGLLPSGRSSG